MDHRITREFEACMYRELQLIGISRLAENLFPGYSYKKNYSPFSIIFNQTSYH